MQRASNDPDFKIKGYNYIPTNFKSLRLVPGYKNYIKVYNLACIIFFLKRML